MTLVLFGHPFSSYCQKVLVALYENATPFRFRAFGPDDPAAAEEWAALWPLKRMPVLQDGARTVMEASVIVEYLDLRHPGPQRFLPAGPEAALAVRLLDRVFDNYVMTPVQRIVFDHMRQPEARDAQGVAEAHALLASAYDWLEGELAGRAWAAGADFGLADCAAAPALFYADWVHPIGPARPRLAAYRARLLGRPSFARAVDEARPYRSFFPPGAPERD